MKRYQGLVLYIGLMFLLSGCAPESVNTGGEIIGFIVLTVIFFMIPVSAAVITEWHWWGIIIAVVFWLLGLIGPQTMLGASLQTGAVIAGILWLVAFLITGGEN